MIGLTPPPLPTALVPKKMGRRKQTAFFASDKWHIVSVTNDIVNSGNQKVVESMG